MTSPPSRRVGSWCFFGCDVTSWVAPQAAAAACLSPVAGMEKVENEREEEENRKKLGRLGSKTCCGCLCGKCPTAGCHVSFLPLIRLFFIHVMLLQHPCSESDKLSDLFEEKFSQAACPGWAGYLDLPAVCFTCRCGAEKFEAKRACSSCVPALRCWPGFSTSHEELVPCRGQMIEGPFKTPLFCVCAFALSSLRASCLPEWRKRRLCHCWQAEVAEALRTTV